MQNNHNYHTEGEVIMTTIFSPGVKVSETAILPILKVQRALDIREHYY